MKGFEAALWSEILKVRKSKVFWITLMFFAFISVMLGFLMLVSKHPELAGQSEMISTKASLIGKANWPSYFNLLLQMVLTVGLLGSGIVTSWVFGREYTDRVVKDLLALPVTRSCIVLSKALVTVLWSLLLFLILYVLGIISGLVVGLEWWTSNAVRQFTILFTGSSLLTLLLSTPVAFIASFSRGYLLSIGYIILTLIITQFIFVGIPGIASYIPWAIPALFARIAGPDVAPPGVVSYMVLGLTSLLGLAGTIAWWKWADQK
jgi:ABC-2 type transport system permease protein